MTILIRWGSSVLQRRFDQPPAALLVGEDPSKESDPGYLTLPLEQLGLREAAPLLRADDGELLVVSWPHASVTVESLDDSGRPVPVRRSPYRATDEARWLRLQPGDVARVVAGAVTFEILLQGPAPLPLRPRLPLRSLALGAAGALLVAGVALAANRQGRPAEDAESPARLEAQRARERLLKAAHERELDLEEFLPPERADNREARAQAAEAAEEALLRRNKNGPNSYVPGPPEMQMERQPQFPAVCSPRYLDKLVDEMRFDPPRELNDWVTSEPWRWKPLESWTPSQEGNYSHRLWPEHLLYLADVGQNSRKRAWFTEGELYPILWQEPRPHQLNPARPRPAGGSIDARIEETKGDIDRAQLSLALRGLSPRLRFCRDGRDIAPDTLPQRYRVQIEVDSEGRVRAIKRTPVSGLSRDEMNLDRGMIECADKALREARSMPPAGGVAQVSLSIFFPRPPGVAE